MQHLLPRRITPNRSSRVPLLALFGLVSLLLLLAAPAQAAWRCRVQDPINSPAGWQPLTLEKTAAEKAEEAHEASAANPQRNFTVHLPPEYDNLRMQLGIGYVQGADWGFELGGAGRMQGATVNFGTLFTQGPQGLRLQSGQFSMLDAISGRRLDAGDLQSDLWGTGRGLRYGWRAGAGQQQALTLYLPGAHEGNSGTVLSYRDEVRLKPDLRVGSEIATDGSFLVKQRYEDRHLGLETYYRHTANDSQNGLGAFLSVAFARGISLYGNVSHTDGTGVAGDTQTVGLRVPLRTGTDVTLEHTKLASPTAKSTLTALMLMTPLGPVRLLTRYQWTQSQNSAFGRFVGIDRRYQDLMFSFGYFHGARASFDYQANIHWQEDGRPVSSTQLVGTLRLSERTQLQLLSDFPDLLNSDKLHLRWNQTLNKRMALSLDYGLLSPYQNSAQHGEERGLMLMLHSHWDAQTVASGSEVLGRVLDPLGHGIKDAGVRLGDYQMLTDIQGRYRFRHVPAGSYELGLMDEYLPTDYKADGGMTKLTVDGRARRLVDLHALPLRMIGGRVWWDKNGNGSFDPGEGMKNVVLHLDDAVTMTGDDGSFAFYNIAPGRYTLRVDVERLPADYTVVSPLELTVDLAPDKSVANQDFRLKPKEKDIQFQSLP